jgi:hypothetical protein
MHQRPTKQKTLTENGRFEAPGSIFTIMNGINAQGDMLGLYINNKGNGHGFLLSKGAFTSIDVPGASAGVRVRLG